MAAAANSQIKSCEKLLHLGANIYLKSCNQLNVLDMAKKLNSSVDLIALLECYL